MTAMGSIFYIFGKSASGKDSIYKRLLEDEELKLRSIVLYTTRPVRDGEKDGETYHFSTEEEFQSLKKKGIIVEDRQYHTVHGLWRYFTVEDSSVDIEHNDYLVTGVLDSFLSTRNYFEKRYGSRDRVVPIYIEVEDGIRLERALLREKRPENRKFREMCRRFLADDEDFSEERLKAAGIARRFINDDLDRSVREIREYILSVRKQKGI
jgi:guanylate kinase